MFHERVKLGLVLSPNDRIGHRPVEVPAAIYVVERTVSLLRWDRGRRWDRYWRQYRMGECR